MAKKRTRFNTCAEKLHRKQMVEELTGKLLTHAKFTEKQIQKILHFYCGEEEN